MARGSKSQLLFAYSAVIMGDITRLVVVAVRMWVLGLPTSSRQSIVYTYGYNKVHHIYIDSAGLVLAADAWLFLQGTRNNPSPDLNQKKCF